MMDQFKVIEWCGVSYWLVLETEHGFIPLRYLGPMRKRRG